MGKSFVLAVMLLVQLSIGLSCQGNELSTGKTAKTAGCVDIAIVPPADFNFKPRAHIFAMRKREVMKHPELLKGKYVPDEDVFGQMEDNRPWWGTVGQSYYGAGPKSIVGPALVSCAILNPYLLVELDMTPTLPKDKVSEADLARKSYPMLYQPTGLRWWPKEAKGEVTFPISACDSQLNHMLGYSGGTTNHMPAGLSLLNARDLGLNYVYIPPSWCYNMRIGSPMSGTMAIPYFIHCGGSCGYPGGCNNISPRMAEVENMEIIKLPARVILMFWKNAPTTGREPADMTFTVNFR